LAPLAVLLNHAVIKELSLPPGERGKKKPAPARGKGEKRPP
jgi:hypothetical protein